MDCAGAGWVWGRPAEIGKDPLPGPESHCVAWPAHACCLMGSWGCRRSWQSSSAHSQVLLRPWQGCCAWQYTASTVGPGSTALTTPAFMLSRHDARASTTLLRPSRAFAKLQFSQQLMAQTDASVVPAHETRTWTGTAKHQTLTWPHLALAQLGHGEGAQLVEAHDGGHGGEHQAGIHAVPLRLHHCQDLRRTGPVSHLVLRPHSCCLVQRTTAGRQQHCWPVPGRWMSCLPKHVPTEAVHTWPPRTGGRVKGKP